MNLFGKSTLLRNLAAIALVLTNASCSMLSNLVGLDKRAALDTNPTGVNFDFCTDPSTTTATAVKLLVILDHSYSNELNYQMFDVPPLDPTVAQNPGLPCVNPSTKTFNQSQFYATDPLGTLRYGDPATAGTLLNFLSMVPANDPANPTRFFALLDFARTIQASYPNTGPASTTGNPVEFTQKTDIFYAYTYCDAHPNSATCVSNAFCLANPTHSYCQPSSSSPPASGSGAPTPAPSLTPGVCNGIDDSNYPTPASTTTSPVNTAGTSYLTALKAAETMINQDITYSQMCAKNQFPSGTSTDLCAHPGVITPVSYIIVFVSDGSPIYDDSFNGKFACADGASNATDIYDQFAIGTPGGAAANLYLCREKSSVILNEVMKIVSMGSGTPYVAGINLFTVYYYLPGNADTAGQTLLSQMAKLGGGTFANAVAGDVINYNNFVPDKKLTKYTLADVFVTNSSITWGNDAKLHYSTNQDGLPDDISPAWTDWPGDPDPLHIGISNQVRYQLSQGNCLFQNGFCNWAPDLSSCSNLKISASQTSLFPSPLGVYIASDPDGLNDCEKQLLSGTVANPDSNGDLLPDLLELIHSVPFQQNTASAANSPLLDGYSNYQKIKYSLPMTLPANSVLNLSSAAVSYNLTQKSSSSVQDCYNLQVPNLPTLGSSNTVRIDVLLNNLESQQNYLYRTGTKMFPAGGGYVHFNDWNSGSSDEGVWKRWPQ